MRFIDIEHDYLSRRSMLPARGLVLVGLFAACNETELGAEQPVGEFTPTADVSICAASVDALVVADSGESVDNVSLRLSPPQSFIYPPRSVDFSCRFESEGAVSCDPTEVPFSAGRSCSTTVLWELDMTVLDGQLEVAVTQTAADSASECGELGPCVEDVDVVFAED